MGEKRFDTVHDLVADGLIHFYIELRAADYISTLSNESNYEESPYLAYNYKSKYRTKARSARRVDLTDGQDTDRQEVSTPVSRSHQLRSSLAASE